MGWRKKARFGERASGFELTGGLGAGAGKRRQGLGEVHLAKADGYDLTSYANEDHPPFSIIFVDEVFEKAGRLGLGLSHGGGPQRVD